MATGGGVLGGGSGQAEPEQEPGAGWAGCCCQDAGQDRYSDSGRRDHGQVGPFDCIRVRGCKGSNSMESTASLMRCQTKFKCFNYQYM